MRSTSYKSSQTDLNSYSESIAMEETDQTMKMQK